MPNQSERRRSPRVSAVNHPTLPVGLIDVSLGGLSLRLHEKLSPGTVHDVGLTLGNGSEVVFRLRVAHTRSETGTGGENVFITGLAFLADVTNSANAERLRLAS